MRTALHDRIGQALERRADPPMHVDLDAVRRGAVRRRNRRRAGTVLALALIAGGAVAGVTVREAETPAPAQEPVVEIPTPAIGAAAILPPDVYGEPTMANASRGLVPNNVGWPQVDVWESTTGRIIVHTHRPGESGAVPEVPVSTAPTTTLAVPPDALVDVAGVRMAELVQIADDQWVAYLSADRDTGDRVVLRGMTRGEAEAALRSLEDVDGVLQPESDYRLVDHADAMPATAPTGWTAVLGFGAEQDVWTYVYEPVGGRSSLETLPTFGPPVEIRTIAGHEVAVAPRDERSPDAYTWLDPSGVFVTLSSWSGRVGAEAIAGVTLIGPAQFDDIASTISAAHAAKPLVARASVEGVDITLRGGPTDVVVCVGVATDEQCAADPSASLGAAPVAATVDAVVGGEWVIAGVFELEGAGDRPVIDDDRYTLPDGSDAPVAVVESDGRLWWTVRVPEGVDVVTTHWQNDVGGIVGSFARPVAVGPIG